jgi:uncharacterized damage-inducible protein DinB
MFPGIVHTLILRELGALRRNILLYPDEASIWALPAGISNSAGTLTLHLVGNIQNYIGYRLGGTDYVRDRPAEFARRDVSRAELLAEIDAAVAAADRGLAAVDSDRLSAMYPEQMGGRSYSTADILVHFAIHLGYHLGQVDYHRRIVTGQNEPAGAMSVLDIPEYQSS